MKYNAQNLALLSAVIAFASCQEHKQATIDESGNEVIKVRRPTEDSVVEITDTAVVKNNPVTGTEKPAAAVSGQKTTSEPSVTKPSEEAVKPGRALTVKGVVKDINKGKDGYTAKLEMTGGQMIAVTISRSNLTNPKSYKEAAIGETLKVTGESWKLGDEDQLTVREIH